MAFLQAKGKLTFLRVQDVGERYGPSADQIDVEVIMKLDSFPDRSMGFQLRNDGQRSARQGMLDVLRDAFDHNWTVTVEYDIGTGKKNGMAKRVALSK